MATNPKGRNGRSSSIAKIENHGKKISSIFDNFSKEISKGFTKTIQKVSKVESTPETINLINALKQLKFIKKRIDSLSDGCITNLYNGQVLTSQHSLALSETLMTDRILSPPTTPKYKDNNLSPMATISSTPSPKINNNSNDNLWNDFTQNVMGRKLFKLNTMTHEYLVKMEKELINPIYIYKTKELQKVNQLIKEYKSIKNDYDFVNHKYNKLINKNKQKNDKKDKKNDKNDKKKPSKKDTKIANQISAANDKKNEKLKLLTDFRTKLMDCIESLEAKQQINLLNCFHKFWQSYEIFAKRQTQIIALADFFENQYKQKKNIKYGSKSVPIATDNDDDKDNNDDDGGDDDDFVDFGGSSVGVLSSSALSSSSDLLKKMPSLRVAVMVNDNQPLSGELRYKNPIKLGSGAFATVYRANDLNDNENEIAIKKISIGDGTNMLYLQSTKKEAENELKIMQLLNGHNNIIKLVDYYYEETIYKDQYLNLVMEYMKETLLSRFEYFANNGDTIPHDLIKIYSFQIIKALNYMHLKKICHRDVKPDNVLINIKTNEIRLCDFGCSIKVKTRFNDDDNDIKDDYNDNNVVVELPDKLESYVCSRYYRAPELILKSSYYDCKIDMWSLGCVISELFLGTLLFCGENNEDEHLDDIIKKLGTPEEDDVDEMNPDCLYKDDLIDRDEPGESFDMLFCAVIDMPNKGIDLISKLLKYSPKNRLSALDCLKHQYFDDLKNNDQYKQLLFQWTDNEIKWAKANGVTL